MSSFLYNEVDKDLREELDARAHVYQDPHRAEHHDWVYKKLLRIEVTAGKRIDGNTAVLPHKGITDKSVFKEIKKLAPPPDGGFEKLYRAVKVKGSGNNDSNIYRPAPVLNSVTMANEGKMGTLRKVHIEFSVFSRSQLDEYESFFLVPGADVQVDYYWTKYAKNKNACAGKFLGIVYNFSIDLRKDGGYDCSCDVVGEGFMITGISATSGETMDNTSGTNTDKNNKSKTTAGILGAMQLELASLWSAAAKKAELEKNGAEEEAIYQGELSTRFAKEASSKRIMIGGQQRISGGSGQLGNHNDYAGTYASFEVNTNVAPANGSEPAEDSPATRVDGFISLEGITSIINELLINRQNKNPKMQYTEIVCNKQITVGYYLPHIRSANPTVMVLPDTVCGDYTVGTVAKTVYAMKGLNPNQIKQVSSAFKQKYKNANTADRGKDPKAYARATAGSQTSYVGPNNFKVDENTADLSKILINTFEIRRIMESMNAKGEGMATIKDFYEQLFAVISDHSGGYYNLGLMFDEAAPNKITIRDMNFTGVGVMEDPKPYVFKPFTKPLVRSLTLSSKLPDKMATALYVGQRGGSTAAVSPDATAVITGNPPAQDLRDAEFAKAAGEYSAAMTMLQSYKDTETVDGAKAAARTLKAASGKHYPGNERMLLPFELSITLDGIEGFKFGNIIAVDYLPSKYRDAAGNLKIVFVVTKVEHSFEGFDWTTKLTTQCRMAS